jgi:hypothetical protein
MARLLGVTVLQFHCIYQNATHVAVWHGGVLLVTTFAGFASGWWLDRNATGRVSEETRVS